MKKNSKILFLIFALVALWSCEQNIVDDNTEVDVEIPKYGYIFFNTEKSTRAELLKGKLEKDFSVLGYKYPAVNDWNTVKVQAKQSTHGVFRPNGNTATATAQEVTYADGAHSYDNLQPWDVKSKYAFFAWYP